MLAVSPQDQDPEPCLDRALGYWDRVHFLVMPSQARESTYCRRSKDWISAIFNVLVSRAFVRFQCTRLIIRRIGAFAEGFDVRSESWKASGGV